MNTWSHPCLSRHINAMVFDRLFFPLIMQGNVYRFGHIEKLASDESNGVLGWQHRDDYSSDNMKDVVYEMKMWFDTAEEADKFFDMENRSWASLLSRLDPPQ